MTVNSIPYISIIVPIYNVEKYLDRCVNSIINQTLKNIEIILVDDGSPDSCPRKCDDWAAKDYRVKVIHKRNAGLGFARNSGLEIATGEYVYFVDSDDYIDLAAAEKLYSAAKSNNVDICLAGICHENGDGNIRKNPAKYAGKLFYQDEIVKIVLAGMLGSDLTGKKNTSLPMSAWQGIYRREWIERYKLRFPSERQFISEDIIFHLHALPLAGSLMYISDCLYYYDNSNQSSLTRKYNSERFDKVGVLYLEEKRLISDLPNQQKLLQRAQNLYLGNVRVCLKQIVAKSKEEGKAFAIKEIEKIVNDPTLQTVLAEYPYHKNAVRQAIMSWCLHKKKIKMIYGLTKAFISK